MKTIQLPLRDEDIRDLRVGDMIYLSGMIVTGRDEVHHRVVAQGIAPPLDLNGMALYHAGPIVKKDGQEWNMVSIGPTSSVRMEKWAADFIVKTGIKMMIGKGGMGEKTAAACREYGVIHCVYPGGCAVLGARQSEKIDGVHWPELGMPEAMWMIQVRAFGPLIVSIDTNGKNMFTDNAQYYASRKDACMKPIIENLRV